MFMIKKMLYVLLAILVILQFIPSNRPETVKDNPADLIGNNRIPSEMATMLKNACYDCHSNESHYPWYAYVAPVSYLINRDIREGRENLNFSDWENLEKRKKLKILGEISDVVLDGEMPMKIYTPLHPEARLTDEDRQAMADWADGFAEKVLEQ